MTLEECTQEKSDNISLILHAGRKCSFLIKFGTTLSFRTVLKRSYKLIGDLTHSGSLPDAGAKYG